MKRRDFLKTTLLASAGGLLLPSAFLSSCRKETLFEETSFSGKVLIIGAGAAGLYAAYILKSKGINFQILEASPRYGGRLRKLEGFADFPIDMGAEWLHGRNSILGDLAVRSGTAISVDNSAEKFWFNNSLVSSLPQTPDPEEYDDLPDQSFRDFFHDKGFGAEYDNIIEAMAGDFGTSSARLSVGTLAAEEENWSSGDDDYKFGETYFDLIDREIAQHVTGNILFDTPVEKIEYGQETIVVTDRNNTSYSADKIIITVPITILKAGDIEFVPPLPVEKTDAFSKIGMDAGMKVFLKFNTKFYDEITVGGSICGGYADDTVGKTTNDHVLMAFIMGEQAEYMNSLGSDLLITNALLQELDVIYAGQATPAFVSSWIVDWTNHPFIRGAYSYSTVGMGDARKVAAQSIDDKLFFAGEAMNINGHHQTVHGAVETGYNAVISLLNSVKK